MKWIGAILVFIACTGFGLAFADEQKRRLKWIQSLKKAIILLRGQILYANAPIAEGLKETGGRMEEKELGQFFEAVAKKVEEGDGISMKQIWAEELEQRQKNWSMEQNELEEFRQFGGELGYLDLSMQEKTLNLYLEKLELSETALLKTLDSKVKLSTSMGVLCGVFLVIILI